MNLYLGLPLMAVLALIHSVLLSRVNLWGARLDLMLLFILTWTSARGVDEGLAWGFLGGLIVDLLSRGPLGATALALMAVAFLTGQPWGQRLGSPGLRLLIVALAGVLVYHLILLISLAWTGHTLDWQFALTRVVLPSVLFNALLAPFIRRPVGWLARRVRREGLTLE